eukprot:1187392-Prorocentrum_minimum.AAC.1
MQQQAKILKALTANQRLAAKETPAGSETGDDGTEGLSGSVRESVPGAKPTRPTRTIFPSTGFTKDSRLGIAHRNALPNASGEPLRAVVPRLAAGR